MIDAPKGRGFGPVLSLFSGLLISLLIIAPNIPYEIPLIKNSFHWCFLAVVSGFFGMLIFHTSINPILKFLSAYLFISCFFSQAPYPSFNAYILIVAALWFFWVLKYADFEVILKFIESAFWLELILVVLQLMGKDTLLNFGSAFRLNDLGNLASRLSPDADKPIFFGTVMQYMRFSSLLAVLTPFLLCRSRLYAVPILALCGLSQSSSFAFSLLAGAFVYGALKMRRPSALCGFLGTILLLASLYAYYDWDSFRGAIIPSNGGRLITWLVVLKTWFLDTSASALVDPWNLTGDFQWKWFLFGHGIDTFLPLFPIYKHDMNPFPQAHNSWLQFLWEIGLVGFLFVVSYCACLVWQLLKVRAYGLVAGLAVYAVLMFLAFPDRMTQTVLLMVLYLAFCESAVKKSRWA